MDAETIGAQGAAGAKVCTPEPISLEGLGEPDRTRRVTVSVPTASGTGPDASGDGNKTHVAEDETKVNVVEDVAMAAGGVGGGPTSGGGSEATDQCDEVPYSR